MPNSNIAFIGGGNMARSLIGGLVAGGVKPDSLWVSDPAAEQLSQLQSKFGINVCADNAQAAAQAEILVLAVKPQIMADALEPMRESVQANQPLVLSIAAGITTSAITHWLGGNIPVVRAMPNTPALVGAGASALYANTAVNPAQKDKAESILRAVGIVQWVDKEELMDAVTALSGSGPAYFLTLMEALEAAGKSLGLPTDAARLLTLQTAYGAAKMALESADSPSTLRERVTSPGGTTQAALESLATADLTSVFKTALTAARDRGQAISKEFSPTQ